MEYLLFPLFSFSASSNTLNPAYPSFFTHEKQDSSKRTTQILKIGIKTNVSRRIIFKPSSNIKIRSNKEKRIRRIVVIGGEKKKFHPTASHIITITGWADFPFYDFDLVAEFQL